MRKVIIDCDPGIDDTLALSVHKTLMVWMV